MNYANLTLEISDTEDIARKVIEGRVLCVWVRNQGKVLEKAMNRHGMDIPVGMVLMEVEGLTGERR